jgi:hypothetical protein
MKKDTISMLAAAVVLMALAPSGAAARVPIKPGQTYLFCMSTRACWRDHLATREAAGVQHVRLPWTRRYRALPMAAAVEHLGWANGPRAWSREIQGL